MMTLAGLLLFAFASASVAWLWNRACTPVEPRIVLLLWLVCVAYLSPTLCTHRVGLPGGLAFVAQPWQALGRLPVRANTGIVFTQLAPWTRVARDAVLHGEMPLWNRFAASGTPLLANQQTAMFHPFTLLGLLLPIGNAFTLSAALRLLFVSFFTFVFLRQVGATSSASLFGAVAYTFSSFHIIWLLFPLGLATMMLPACLATANEYMQNERPSSYVVLVAALAFSVLGGHPESALWVWVVTACYAAGTCLAQRRFARLAMVASTFVFAMLLTAFFWYPTLRLLPATSRYHAMQSREANPPDHGLSAEWLFPLVAPNVLGNPVNGTYVPPRGSHPAVLSDYGEVASAYSGLATLALALAAPLLTRRRSGLVFAMALMLFALLTIAEVPLWRDVLHAIPFAGITLQQRLRVLWNLGTCIAATFSLDALLAGASRRTAILSFSVCSIAYVALYALRRPPMQDALALVQFAAPLVAALAIAIVLAARIHPAAIVLLVFCDLVAATFRYNPSAEPRDVYPTTGAIRYLQTVPRPSRMAAIGWSFLADTPSYYGIEDVKTTDPIENEQYMRLLRGYLRTDGYDLVIGDVSQPFFDFLNIRYLYVPPDQPLHDARFAERYRGPDGAVFENLRAMPRYALVAAGSIEPDFGMTVWRSRAIADFRLRALVDHVPTAVRRLGLHPDGDDLALSRGTVRVVRYGAATTELEVRNTSWSLLTTSDVAWPGWRVYVNGQRLPPVVINGAFNGCFIPPGGGRVVLRYHPDSYDSGLRCGAAGLLLLGIVLVVWNRRRLQ
jgi:hypothetical protein